MTTGQRAMASALVLADDGRRENGRFAWGSGGDLAPVQNATFRSQVSRAGVILDFAPELVGQVIAGALPRNFKLERSEGVQRCRWAPPSQETGLCVGPGGVCEPRSVCHGGFSLWELDEPLVPRWGLLVGAGGLSGAEGIGLAPVLLQVSRNMRLLDPWRPSADGPAGGLI